MPELFDINNFLKKAVAMGASDIHLKIGEHPVIRKEGKIIKIDMPKLTDEDVQNVLNVTVPKNFKTRLKSLFDADFPYEIPGTGRFRINLSIQLGKNALAIRTIPYKIKTAEELNLPVSIEDFAGFNNGLVLITGPTGSGKSTTLAALINHINNNRSQHIITIEDPVEFIFQSKKSIISQRQVGVDTPSFSEGVKYAMRQDPDVILIGEIRDKDTIESALKAAETGHLVFATLHTNDSVQTINRIVNMFDPSDRDFVRNQVANILRGTISQKLIPTIDGSARMPACEILVCTPTVKDFIIKNELEQIYELVKKGSFNDMLTLNMSLFKFVEKGVISQEDALAKSNDKNELEKMFKGVYHGTNSNMGN